MLCKRPSALRCAYRQASVVPLLAVTLVTLVGFLALGIDLGMLVIAKSQAQNTADVAALTAARTLIGDSTVNYNQTSATTNAQNVASYNKLLGQSVQSSQLQLSYGTYDYNQTTQTFNANFPGTSGMPTTAVSSIITSNNSADAFSSIFGMQFLPTVTATATAVHRPRDIALVMDLSGSMRMGTCLGYDFYTTTRTTNNPDTAYPTFGHYSSASAGMYYPSSSGNRTSSYDSYTISPSNTTAANTSYSLTYANNFYQNTAYATPLVRAFDSYTSTDGGATWSAPGSANPLQASLPTGTSYTVTPGGDVPLFKKGSTTTYATDVNDVVGSTARNASWELDGYSNYTNGSLSNAATGQSNYQSAPFNGYTQGPGYYGKTFFLWPPDPRQPLTTASNSTQINQFLQDFGYVTATDFANAAFKTTPTTAITKTQTSISVNSSTPFPISSPLTAFRIIVDSEIMLVTKATGTTWTVTRAQGGTAAATHAATATVGLVTGLPLTGIYGSNSTSNSQSWPWPNDGGTTLGNYLTSNVYIPYSLAATSSPITARLLKSGDAQYQQIMRLYNWNYVIDSLGTTPCDWRVRFFGTNSNTTLFNSSGVLNVPSSSTYTINYNEILRWISQSANPFPQQMRAGRIKYYASIPTQITGSWPSYGSTDQQFWKEFIDYALGFRQTAASTYTDISAMAGYGSDFTWGTLARNAVPSATQYMNYSDNPARPKLRYWFGPMAMIDYLQNFNIWTNMPWTSMPGYFVMQPGDSYEAPVYTAKQAYLASISTMQTNHPNDWFTTVCYSWPRSSSNGTVQSSYGLGRFNCVRSPLGPNYSYAQASLVFPFSTLNTDGSVNNTEITPYDSDSATSIVPSANFVDTPRRHGETCFAMALMLAYNQFATTLPTDSTLRSFVSSSPITFPTGMAGGMGRKGAQKVIIFETDGLANTAASATLVNAGTYKYYKVRYDMNNPSKSEFPTVSVSTINDSNVLNPINSLVTELATDYGSSRNPFRLYAIGFGPVFTGADASSALQTLQNMQYYAGTQSSASTALPTAQIITGTDTQMSANMNTTFTNILQNGVQIALIK